MKTRFNPQPKPAAKKAGMRSKSAARRSTDRGRPRQRHAASVKQLRSQPGYVRCMFTLTLGEVRIIQICMQERDLPPGSYNAALQKILAEWKVLKEQAHHPVLMAVPADMLPRGRAGSEE